MTVKNKQNQRFMKCFCKVWDHQFSTYDKFPEKLFLPRDASEC